MNYYSTIIPKFFSNHTTNDDSSLYDAYKGSKLLFGFTFSLQFIFTLLYFIFVCSQAKKKRFSTFSSFIANSNRYATVTAVFILAIHCVLSSFIVFNAYLSLKKRIREFEVNNVKTIIWGWVLFICFVLAEFFETIFFTLTIMTFSSTKKNEMCINKECKCENCNQITSVRSSVRGLDEFDESKFEKREKLCLCCKWSEYIVEKREIKETWMNKLHASMAVLFTIASIFEWGFTLIILTMFRYLPFQIIVHAFFSGLIMFIFVTFAIIFYCVRKSFKKKQWYVCIDLGFRGRNKIFCCCCCIVLKKLFQSKTNLEGEYKVGDKSVNEQSHLISNEPNLYDINSSNNGEINHDNDINIEKLNLRNDVNNYWAFFITMFLELLALFFMLNKDIPELIYLFPDIFL